MPEKTLEAASSAISAYSRLKEDLLRCIDEMLAMECIRGCPCEELREKIRTSAFNLVVVGQFKRGKTSLINALLGADILPVAVVPLTSIVTVITYGDALRIKVCFNDGKSAEIKRESLHEYVTERGNPKNVRDVDEVVVTYPSPYLRGGVRLIDTPGVGSIYQHNTDVAYRYLPKSDAVLFLLSVDQPVSRAELDFLNDVREYSDRIFFLLNKADQLDEKDLKESTDFQKNVLRDATGSDVRIYPLSAKLALDGKLNEAEDVIGKSLLPQFSEKLNAFLMEEKGRVLISSAAGNLMRLISQSRLELELELKSLATPLEELQRKIAAFEAKKQEVILEKKDFDILLDGETKRLTGEVLGEDMTNFSKELLSRERARLEELFSQAKALSSKELKKTIEESIVSNVKQAFNIWRAMEDDKLARDFEAICKRFVVKIDNAVDELLKFSSDLFEIPFETVKTEALWSARSRFYYKFNEQPVGIEIVASSLTLALPKFLGDRIIHKKMREHLTYIVDLQLGRSGNDFDERIQRSKLDFRWEMLQRIEATIEGIGTAVEKGMAQRNRSKADIEKKSRELGASLHALAEIRDRIERIRSSVERQDITSSPNAQSSPHS